MFLSTPSLQCSGDLGRVFSVLCDRLMLFIALLLKGFKKHVIQVVKLGIIKQTYLSHSFHFAVTLSTLYAVNHLITENIILL